MRLGVEAALVDGHLVQGDVEVVDGRVAGYGLASPNGQGVAAPGFVDLQVNGFYGVDFLEADSDGYRRAGDALLETGVTAYLPTFITDTPQTMAEAIKAADAAMQARTPGVLGIHLEGPFLNPERKGIHRADLMRAIGDSDVAMIDLPAGGRVLVTLAPEKTEPSVIARLTQSGIIVAAGHTKADVETIRKAQGAGLTGITHLFNAMPPLMGREQAMSLSAVQRAGRRTTEQEVRRDGGRAQRLRASSRSRERGAARGGRAVPGLYRPQPAARRRVGAR